MSFIFRKTKRISIAYNAVQFKTAFETRIQNQGWFVETELLSMNNAAQRCHVQVWHFLFLIQA